jgi:hypothetical protein
LLSLPFAIICSAAINRLPHIDSVVGGFEAGSLSEEELIGADDSLSSACGVLWCFNGNISSRLPRFVPANPLKPGIASAGAALARIANQAVVFIVKLTWLREDRKGVESKGRTNWRAKEQNWQASEA